MKQKIIHTLGPKQTDSYQAACHFAQKFVDKKIVLHDSFAAIYAQVTKLGGEYLVVPAAYQSEAGLTWGQLHYRYVNQLKLVAGFVHPLADLALVKHPESGRTKAYTHPATTELLKEVTASKDISFAPSKVAAYQQFLKDGKYVVTSAKLVEDPEWIIYRQPVEMLWSVYQILEERR